MKYYICAKQENNLEIKDELTIQQYTEYKGYIKNLKYYSLSKHFKDICIKNGIEFEQFLTKIKNESIKSQKEGVDIGIEGNRLALNYLVSFRTFVDNVEAYSKKIINGQNFKTNVLSKIYDSENLYAFFYKLRNFLAHTGILFDSIEVILGKVELQCSKEHLLEYKEWKAENKIFLNSCPEYLPIQEYVNKMNVLVMSVYLGFIQYFAQELQEMHNNMINLMKKYKIINPIFIECEDIRNLENANIFGLGLSILKEATEELAQLPNVKINYIKEEDILDE